MAALRLSALLLLSIGAEALRIPSMVNRRQAVGMVGIAPLAAATPVMAKGAILHNNNNNNNNSSHRPPKLALGTRVYTQTTRVTRAHIYVSSRVTHHNEQLTTHGPRPDSPPTLLFVWLFMGVLGV